MSACISSRGEYSNHELDDEQTCKWCGVFDEEAFRRVNLADAHARGRREGQQWAIDALRDDEAFQAWYRADIEGTHWYGSRPARVNEFQLATAARYLARSLDSEQTGDSNGS